MKCGTAVKCRTERLGRTVQFNAKELKIFLKQRAVQRNTGFMMNACKYVVVFSLECI